MWSPLGLALTSRPRRVSRGGGPPPPPPRVLALEGRRREGRHRARFQPVSRQKVWHDPSQKPFLDTRLSRPASEIRLVLHTSGSGPLGILDSDTQL